ncbi:DUF1656 domain-containing protein [Enterobacter sp. Cy-643]|uniref:DUF1656 domain-containing protein n=1 Tax=Enterobacter sp. Cy-643 TaxID=2608346 RepID=UPI00141E3865|nr:DUF1656 domain-containing protein [Enterobacter sp. Cy-643]NIF30845.1 DUF1656 domain-containing protein [Enterobacter sp. Cy-643]
MIGDVNIGGVYLPGLLVIALVALLCTLFLLSRLMLSGVYRRLPWRPLIDFAAYIFTAFLLLQGLNAQGFIV